MSILDALPHRATAYPRVRVPGQWGSGRDRRGDAVWTNKPCWQQTAGEAEVNRYAKRGIEVTDKIYFTENVDLTEVHTLVVTNTLAGSTVDFDVKTRAVPDASAGLGVVWRVMVSAATDEGDDI